MDLLQRFMTFIRQEDLFHPGDKLLLAVSGGIDSVALCHLCRQAGFDFVIAHCNFQLRKEESDRDEQFVRQLAAELGVLVWVKKFDTTQYAEAKKLSIQEAARELRYHWFYELVNSREPGMPAYIVTAHHAGDNIETMLMHFFRGTGIQGLRGMLPRQGKVVRPLLAIRREELLQFIQENGLSWVEDSSNALDKYSRNYIRHQVMPLVQKIFPEAAQNLEGNLRRFRETEMLYQEAVVQHKKKLMEKRGEEWHIPVLKLKKTAASSTILFEILKDFGFTAAQTVDAVALLDSETGKYIQSASHRLLKNRNWLIIAPLQPERESIIVIDEGEAKVIFANGELLVEKLPASNFTLPVSPLTACLDAKMITFPLLLRKWKNGDYFYPLGMKKKKKVARFLIDSKLSKNDKEKVWVLEMNKKIIWIAGHRIDDRFKITGSTRELLRIDLKVMV